MRDEVEGDVPVDADRVVEALVALDELLNRDRVGPWPPNLPSAASRSALLSTRVVSRAPAPVRGFKISGNPTALANSYTSAALCAAAAVGMPAARSASFIDGLSRHNHAVRTDVPGIVQLSRT